MEQKFYNDSIFHIEVEKISPNPYQPRHEFDEGALRELADSIRQYGVLQPIVVTRREVEKSDGGIAVEYELVAGERRLRASKIAMLKQIPAVIRASEDSDRMKLELAIIENLQREDLNPIDRARAFKKLSEQFGFKHSEIAKKVGKSREYVSNTIRLLTLPEEIIRAISERRLNEGHARPLMMLIDKPREQETLFKEIIFKKMTVREAESIARRIAHDKVRKHDLDPEMLEMEEKLTEMLGTRVRIDKKAVGGRVMIDFFSSEDLLRLLDSVNKEKETENSNSSSDIEALGDIGMHENVEADVINNDTVVTAESPDAQEKSQLDKDLDIAMGIDSPKNNNDDRDIYSVKNFSI